MQSPKFASFRKSLVSLAFVGVIVVALVGGCTKKTTEAPTGVNVVYRLLADRSTIGLSLARTGRAPLELRVPEAAGLMKFDGGKMNGFVGFATQRAASGDATLDTVLRTHLFSEGASAPTAIVSLRIDATAVPQGFPETVTHAALRIPVIFDLTGGTASFSATVGATFDVVPGGIRFKLDEPIRVDPAALGMQGRWESARHETSLSDLTSPISLSIEANFARTELPAAR